MEELALIIEKCKSGNRDAQKQLYFLTIKKLKSVIIRYCNNIQDAEDALQNTYLIVFEKIKSFNSNKGNFNSWATRILINEYFQKLRNQKNRNLQLEEINEKEISLEFNWSKFTLEEAVIVISGMKESHKVIMNLYYIEQYEYNEIAELLNLKESSVRGNLSRARKIFDALWNDLVNHKKVVNEY